MAMVRISLLVVGRGVRASLSEGWGGRDVREH